MKGRSLGTIGVMGTPTLAVSDLVDFQVHLIGDIEPVFWAEFYLLGSCENDVVRYDLATGTLEPIGTLIENIRAVSAMTCVQAPNEADAGADAGAPASDAALE